MELRALKKKFASYRESMQDVMKSGAAVSPGKRGVESGIAFRRHPSYRKAVIEKYGEEAADRIREETPYKPYFYVRLITRNGTGRKGGA